MSEDVTWSSPTFSKADFVMIGDDVYQADADGAWHKVGTGWHIRFGPDGGALEAGEPT